MLSGLGQLFLDAPDGVLHAPPDVDPRAFLEFSDETWHVVGDSARIEAFGGRAEALRLDNSTVFLTSVSLRDAVIEFDINHPDDRAFLGVIFRAQDFGNFEEFYIRPHRSEVPDSFQYTPVFHGSYGWQLYAGAGFFDLSIAWQPRSYRRRNISQKRMA
jgi:hypothetical protein